MKTENVGSCSMGVCIVIFWKSIWVQKARSCTSITYTLEHSLNIWEQSTILADVQKTWTNLLPNNFSFDFPPPFAIYLESISTISF